MANPNVPAVHMNTRFLTTTKRWFGGGADLNPAIPCQEDTDAFHARFRAACAAHDPTFYPRFSKWAEEYFCTHRRFSRGWRYLYDYLEDISTPISLSPATSVKPFSTSSPSSSGNG